MGAITITWCSIPLFTKGCEIRTTSICFLSPIYHTPYHSAEIMPVDVVSVSVRLIECVLSESRRNNFVWFLYWIPSDPPFLATHHFIPAFRKYSRTIYRRSGSRLSYETDLHIVHFSLGVYVASSIFYVYSLGILFAIPLVSLVQQFPPSPTFRFGFTQRLGWGAGSCCPKRYFFFAPWTIRYEL